MRFFIKGKRCKVVFPPKIYNVKYCVWCIPVHKKLGGKGANFPQVVFLPYRKFRHLNL